MAPTNLLSYSATHNSVFESEMDGVIEANQRQQRFGQTADSGHKHEQCRCQTTRWTSIPSRHSILALQIIEIGAHRLGG